MTKSKTTKRALLASVLSMLLCVAMLVGSTFAWFTDSTGTDNNRIKAGNLKIALETRLDDNGKYDQSKGYKELTNEIDALFGEDTLWEPGQVYYRDLRIVNKGTLAAKCNVNISDLISLNYALDPVFDEDGRTILGYEPTDYSLFDVVRVAAYPGTSADFVNAVNAACAEKKLPTFEVGDGLTREVVRKALDLGLIEGQHVGASEPDEGGLFAETTKDSDGYYIKLAPAGTKQKINVGTEDEKTLDLSVQEFTLIAYWAFEDDACYAPSYYVLDGTTDEGGNQQSMPSKEHVYYTVKYNDPKDFSDQTWTFYDEEHAPEGAFKVDEDDIIEVEACEDDNYNLNNGRTASVVADINKLYDGVEYDAVEGVDEESGETIYTYLPKPVTGLTLQDKLWNIIGEEENGGLIPVGSDFIDTEKRYLGTYTYTEEVNDLNPALANTHTPVYETDEKGNDILVGYKDANGKIVTTKVEQTSDPVVEKVGRLKLGFDIVVYATQWDYEPDSFDNTYDKNATYKPKPSTGISGTGDNKNTGND